MNNLQIYAEVQRRLLMPYHRVISGDPEEGYLGEVAELPGCFTAGETPEEALANLEEAMTGWLKAAYKNGFEVPEPASRPLVVSA